MTSRERGPDHAPADPRPLVYVSGYGGHIRAFRLDAAAGTLDPAAVVPGGRKPSFLAWNAAGTRLYSVDELESRQGQVVAYAVDHSSGALVRLGAQPSLGVGPTHLALDATGRWLLVAHYAGGHSGIVSVLPVLHDGNLGPGVASEDFGVDARPHQVAVDASNRFVLVPCLGLDAVAQLRFDPATGRIARNQPDRVVSARGSGPRHLDFHPSQKFAYVINELDSTMTAYRFDAASGRLEEIHTASTLPEGCSSKNSGAEVHVHPSGKFLYGSNRGHDSIVIFALDPATGRMTLRAHETRALKTPRHFSLDPGGHLLCAASQDADHVSLYRVDAETGLLALVGPPTFVDRRPSFVQLLPRGSGGKPAAVASLTSP